MVIGLFCLSCGDDGAVVLDVAGELLVIRETELGRGIADYLGSHTGKHRRLAKLHGINLRPNGHFIDNFIAHIFGYL